MHFNKASLIVLGALLAAPASADFSYQETTRITGGSVARMMKMVPGGGKTLEAQTSSIYLKGNKLANATAKSVSIIDLDAETVTDINLEKKSYSVITFQEMAAAMEAARKKMEAELNKQGAQQQASLSFSVKVEETGQRKQISGYDTKEMHMLLQADVAETGGDTAAAMTFDVNMWLAPRISGYEQVQQFYMRMAQKMDWHPRMASLAGVMNMQPGMGQGMAEMMKEMQKLEGVPVYQVTTLRGGAMGAMGEMPNLSEVFGGQGRDAGDVAADQARRSANDRAARSTGGRLGGLAGSAASGALGGFGGLRRKRPQTQPEPEPDVQQNAGDAPKAGVFMELTSESSNFSTAAVDPTRFDVPAGYKQVEHEMKKLLK